MKTTAQLIEEARENLPKFGHAATFYRLGKETGLREQQIYTHRKRGIVWSDEVALKISPFLNYPPEIILLWAKMEREKNPDVMAVLERMEQRLNVA